MSTTNSPGDRGSGGGILLAAAATALFSTSPVLIRWAAPLSPEEITAGRLAVAAAALWFLRRGTVPRFRIPAKDRVRFLLFGLIASLHFLFYIASLSLTTIAQSLTLVYTAPIFVALFSAWFLHEPLARRKWIGIAAAVAGIAVMAGFEPRMNRRMLCGDLLALGSAVMFGFYSIAGRSQRDRYPLLTYAGAVYAAAAFWALPAAAWRFDPAAWTPGTAAAVAALGLIPLGAGHTLYNAALRRTHAAVVNLIASQEVTGGVILGILFLREIPTLHEILGAALALAGVAVVILSRNDAEPGRASKDRRPAPGEEGMTDGGFSRSIGDLETEFRTDDHGRIRIAAVLWDGRLLDIELAAAVGEAAEPDAAPVAVVLADGPDAAPLNRAEQAELAGALRAVDRVVAPADPARLRPLFWTVPHGVAGANPDRIRSIADGGAPIRLSPPFPGRDATAVLERAAAGRATPMPGTPPPPAIAGRNRVLDGESLAAWVERQRAERRRIVTVNGCFDLLHPGHVRFLAAAAQAGDRLLVLLNDDASVARYKGPARPFIDQGARAVLLASLRMVDAVHVFPEDDPLRALETIRPDVHCKGGTYVPERARAERDLVERHGGELRFLPMEGDFSSTALSDRIRTRRRSSP